jgi:hypothetical protein
MSFKKQSIRVIVFYLSGIGILLTSAALFLAVNNFKAVKTEAVDAVSVVSGDAEEVSNMIAELSQISAFSYPYAQRTLVPEGVWMEYYPKLERTRFILETLIAIACLLTVVVFYTGLTLGSDEDLRVREERKT